MGREKGRSPDGREELLSLREIGRRLNIPPSTVVYYKDRFERYIPHAGGLGRRRRYPLRALEVFKGIREMYDAKFSAKRIEKELAARFGELLADARQGAPASSRTQAATLDALMERLGGLVESQSVYRREIAALQREVADLKAEAAHKAREHRKALNAERRAAAERRRALEADNQRLAAENARLERYVRDRVEKDNPLHKKPSSAFLALPLVIRTGGGEYLGVAGRGRAHFATRDFLSLIQRSQCARRSVSMLWDRDRDHWVLRVEVNDGGRRQEIVMELAQTLTPSRNLVARLVRMAVDRQEVPDTYLLALFRQIKDGLRG